MSYPNKPPLDVRLRTMEAALERSARRAGRRVRITLGPDDGIRTTYNKDTNTMTRTKITAVPVRDLRAGDEFHDGPDHVWTAVDDARFAGRTVTVRVQYAKDGGIDSRTWDDADHTLTIRREV
jgi:hypothetical protein